MSTTTTPGPAAATTTDRTATSAPTRGLHVALMGAPIGIGNRGVSALGTSVVRLLFQQGRETQISLLTGLRNRQSLVLQVDGQVREVQVVPYRLSPRAKLQVQLWWIVLLSLVYRFVGGARLQAWIRSVNPWVRTLATADLVADIRGGDSFSDIYGLRRFLTGAVIMLTVLLVRGEIALLPQTYGPYRTRLARGIARSILLRARPILSRDRTGLEVVDQVTGGRRRAAFCPDVAFALEVRVPESLEIEPPLSSAPGGRILVGLNVNGLMYNGGYTRDNMFTLKLDYPRFLDELLGMLLRLPNVEVLLVPHTFAPPDSVESDNAACVKLRKKVPAADTARVHVVVKDYDQHEIKGVIGLCDFFIGSRMHACIAALSQGIPTVGVAYSRKFTGVFDCVGMAGWVVDGKVVDGPAAVQRVQALFEARHGVALELRSAVPKVQKLLAETFGLLVNGRKPENS